MVDRVQQRAAVFNEVASPALGAATRDRRGATATGSGSPYTGHRRSSFPYRYRFTDSALMERTHCGYCFVTEQRLARALPLAETTVSRCQGHPITGRNDSVDNADERVRPPIEHKLDPVLGHRAPSPPVVPDGPIRRLCSADGPQVLLRQAARVHDELRFAAQS